MSEIPQNPGGGPAGEIKKETPIPEPSAALETNVAQTEVSPSATSDQTANVVPIATAVPSATAVSSTTAVPSATAVPPATPVPSATAVPSVTAISNATAALTEVLPSPSATAVLNATPVATTLTSTDQVAKDENKPNQNGNVEISPSTAAAVQNAVVEIKTDGLNKPQDSGDWLQRESQLLKIIEDLEKVKCDAGADGLKLELKVREEEVDLLKARVKNLETELQASLSKPGSKNHEMIESIKNQHEELLTKARGMIFDKTKMVKNQELQIEALNTQVQSLKDINGITKDMLTIRNAEVKSLEERLQVMEAKFKSEKDRFDLMIKRAETNTSLNADLKKEYETQLAIFKELRGKYEERVQALVAENARLKNPAPGNSSAT